MVRRSADGVMPAVGGPREAIEVLDAALSP